MEWVKLDMLHAASIRSITVPVLKNLHTTQPVENICVSLCVCVCVCVAMCAEIFCHKPPETFQFLHDVARAKNERGHYTHPGKMSTTRLVHVRKMRRAGVRGFSQKNE